MIFHIVATFGGLCG